MARHFSGGQLRAARIAAGLKPEHLAVHIGRSVYSIHEYERGRALPSVAALARLADALNVSLDALFIEGIGPDTPAWWPSTRDGSQSG